MLRQIFSMSGFNCSVAFATGGAWGYAFANPDERNVYDIFPVRKPPPYAFINVFKVPEEKSYDFESAWRELARWRQGQDGYLFTQLHKAKAVSSKQPVDDTLQAEYQYIDVSQWTTGDAHRRALLRTMYQSLVDKMPFESCSQPLMYSMVVDDQPKQV
mmetsp:Transcript_64520/g.120050  ORF Transcript_64520/g.120050 Transcript_64520/m.120050 type:complete len:158 (-) Transcript_64520:81-554(-)